MALHDEGKWHETLQALRIQLHRGMDGAIASQQRKLGLEYGINFGVNILRLRELAKSLPKEDELANLMWAKDVREMKLLSLMIRVPSSLSVQEALKLARETETLEVAEQLVFILLQRVPNRGELLKALFSDHSLSASASRAIPYLLLGRLAQDDSVSVAYLEGISQRIVADFSDASLGLHSIIYNTLQRLAYDRPDCATILRGVCEQTLMGNCCVAHALAKDIIQIIEEESV